MTATTLDAAAATDATLFPLPLTPFEAFLTADDDADYPMVFYGELRFRGELDRQAFQQAVATASMRHPLLRSVVRGAGPSAAWHALAPDEAVAPIDWAARGMPIAAYDDGRIDLSRRPGVRFWVRIGDGESEVLVQFHHACVDGHGAMRYLEDVLTAYAAARSSSPDAAPTLRPLEPDRLRRRGIFTAPATPPQAAALRRWWHPYRDALRFHFLPPKPVAVPKPRAGAGPPSFPGIASHFFDDEQSRAIRGRVAAQAGTINDAALTALLRTLRDWDQEQGGSDRGGRYRVLVPVDLRTRGDEFLPAANRMTFSFVVRNAREGRDPAQLLASIRDETQYVKSYGVGLDFLHALGLLHARDWMHRIAGTRRCLATAVLTNMGDPTRRFQRFPRREGRCEIGDVILESITGSPPIRPLTRCAFGIGVYAGRIVLNARCDARHFFAGDAERLVTMFAERLGES